MICPLQKEETAPMFLDYSAGRLNRSSIVVLERHMESCPDCAALRTEQAVVWAALDAWKPSPVSVDFNRRLWQRIEAAPWFERLFESLRLTPLPWKPVLPLTAAILIVAAGFLFDHPGGGVPVPAAPAAASVSVTEAEQVEQTLDDIQLLHQLNAGFSATPGSAKKM
jgi:hypothetical protein